MSERAIALMRKILDASPYHLNNCVLDHGELDTSFKKCMAIIKNTPLYKISHNINDPYPICHANLVLFKNYPNLAPLETSQTDLNSYDKLRWRRV